ncbi:MAG: hypothetical protein PGN33_26270 [Methylobacterium radiotolerans]
MDARKAFCSAPMAIPGELVRAFADALSMPMATLVVWVTEEMITETPFVDDVLHGEEEIAAFMYGDAKQHWRVFYLVENPGCRCFAWERQAACCATWFQWAKLKNERLTAIGATCSSIRHQPSA